MSTSAVDVAVDLPSSNVERQPRPDQPIFLTVKSDLTLALGDAAVSRDTLQSALDALSKGDRSQRVFLRADKSVAYGDIGADEETGLPLGLGFDTISGFSSLMQDNKLRAVFAKKPD